MKAKPHGGPALARVPSRGDLPEVVDRSKVVATRRALPEGEVLQDAAEVFRALASPVRLSIVHALAHDELSVGDLAHALDLALSVTSQQLSILRRLKLVAKRDEGRLTFYRVVDDRVEHLVHDCLVHVERGLGKAGDHGDQHTHGVKR